MEIQQLRHFLMAVRYGNLGQAAEELRITQSGLSRSIKALEDSVGLALLVRSSRGVTPSQYGEILIPHAQAIVNERTRVVDTLRQIRQGREGTINVGVTINFSHYFMPDILAEFYSKQPNVELVVKTGAFPNLIQSLQLAELDILLGLFVPEPGGLPAGMTMEPLFETKSVIVCPGDHEFTKRSVSAQELSTQPWGLPDSDAFVNAFSSYFQLKGLPVPRQVIRTNSLALLRRSVTKMGIFTILPPEVIEPELVSGELGVVDSFVPGGVTQTGLAYRAEDNLPPAARKFIKLIKSTRIK